jgi:hypothetical protein
MVEALRVGGVEIARLRAAVEVGGTTYAAGSYVIRGDQPFRPYVVDLFGTQQYPELPRGPGGAPARPYDVTGWTLPAQMGVRVDRVAQALDAETEPVRAPVLPGAAGVRAAQVTPATVAVAFDPRANAAHGLAAAALRDGARVVRLAGPLQAGEETWPAGGFVVAARPGSAEAIAAAASRAGVPATALEAIPAGPAWRLALPRIGLYQAWGGNADEGWTRFVLDTAGIAVTTIHDADVRNGSLQARFDVVVLPDAGYDAMLHGLTAGTVPEEYTGGLTPRGVAALYEFVSAGGTLVALDSATELPLTAFATRWTSVTRGLGQDAFSAPGSLVRLVVDPDAPLAMGMPPEATAFFDQGAAFGPRTGEATPPGAVAARYAPRDLLVSGYLIGADRIAGRPAVVEVPVGEGRVVLLGFRTQHRGQTHGTFKFLLNALWRPATSPAPGPAAERLAVAGAGTLRHASYQRP